MTALNDNVKKHWNLYVLRLERDKYYVGITTKTPEERMWEHRQGLRGASWTQIHKPLAIIEQQSLGFVTEADAKAIENKKTREVMRQFGYNNVRGGDLTYRGNYIVWLRWLIEDKDLSALYSALALLGIILFFAILYVVKK